MVKVLYSGDISPCRIVILNTRINSWKKGEAKELGEREASKLVNENRNFSYMDEDYKQPEEPKEEKPKKKMSFDLDGDGDFDKDDLSIAGRVMSKGRKLRNK